MTLYRYGWIAWIWRVMIFLALAGGGLLAGMAVLQTSGMLFLVAVPLLLPALFFGAVVAVSVELISEDEVKVVTLSFWKRRIDCSRLGRPRYYSLAQGHGGSIHAPRLWVPVKGGLPVYLDLLARIPDRGKFGKVFGKLPRGVLSRNVAPVWNFPNF